ncbi:oligosaccharide flippase family protein [Kineococcus sp. NUM-3379]
MTRLARLGVIAAVSSRVFGRLVGIFLVIVLARSADPTTVALYGFLLGTVTLTASLTDLGVASLAGRDVAAGTSTAPVALRSSLGPQGLSIALAAGLTCVVALVAGPGDVGLEVLLPCVIFVAANGLLNLWCEILRGAGRVAREGWLQSVSAAVLAVVGSIAVLHGAGIVPLLWIVAGKEIAALLVAAAWLRPRRSTTQGPTFSFLLRRSAWLAGAGAALVVLWRQGTVLVSALASVDDLAQYVVATRFLDAGVTIAHTIGIGLFPALAGLAARGPGHARRHVRRYTVLIGAASIPLAVAGALLAGPVTLALFGYQWTSAVGAVRAIALSAPAILLSYLFWYTLLAEGRQKWLGVGAAAGAATSLLATAALLRAEPSAAAGAWGTTAGAFALTSVLAVGLLVRTKRTGTASPVQQPSEHKPLSA